MRRILRRHDWSRVSGDVPAGDWSGVSGNVPGGDRSGGSGEIVEDGWRYFASDGAASDIDAPATNTSGPNAAGANRAAGADALIVPFTELKTNATRWREHSGPLGVRLAPADKTEELAEFLPYLTLVAIEFPNAGDGRGYSHARILRERLGFKGELRAVGAGVKQDQIFLMARCGFDSMDLTASGESLEDGLRALRRYTVGYQPGDPRVTVTRQRFFA